MAEKHYAYAVAYMKTFENKMLTMSDVETLINAKDVNQAKKLLADKGYGDARADDMLKSELEKVWSEAKNACGEDAPLDVLLYKNDFHNLKTILKAVVSEVSFEDMVLNPCITDPDVIENAVKTQEFDKLPVFLKEPAEAAYKLIGETRDGQMLEAFLDKACLLAMKERADREKSEFLSGWVDLNILIANMKTVARATGKNADFIKNAIVDTAYSEKLVGAAVKPKSEVEIAIAQLGYKEGAELFKKSFSDFEKWCDNLKLRYVKKMKNNCFGFEPILAFLIGKEFEIQTVRIILAGKENSVPSEIIRERLRDMYV